MATTHTTTTPFFSIVIPTLNEVKYLPKLLSDLARQSYQDFEIIHVDGQSDDYTVQKAATFAKKLALHTETVSVRNVSYQRNAGAKLAKGQWVLFFDADNRLPAYFLDGLRYKIAKDPAVDIFTTWIKVDGHGQFFRTIEQTVNFTLELYNQVDRSFAPGAMIGIRRKHCRKNEFDQQQKILEDYYFVKSAVSAGLNFSIFREPRYTLSLRRYRKEALKTIAAGAVIQFKYLRQADFSKSDHGYTMQGGAYYDLEPTTMLATLSAYIQKGSQKQIELARKVFVSLTKDL
jgi:glycosyltransferase involved in cell wall biosynthesis